MVSAISTRVHTRAEVRERRSQLDTDIARADDDQAPGHGIERECVVRGNHSPLERQVCEFHWLRTGREHEVARRDADRARRGIIDVDGLSVDEPPVTVENLHLALAQQARYALVQTMDDTRDPLLRFRKIERGRKGQSERCFSSTADSGEMRGFDQRLGRNASDVQAGSPKPAAFDEHGFEPKLAAADRSHIAARTAAQHQHVGRYLVQCGDPMNIVAGSSSRDLRRCTNDAASCPSITRWSNEDDRFIIRTG